MMFKIANLENELFHSMEKKLTSNQLEDNHKFAKLAKAIDYLKYAAEIFEDAGMDEEAYDLDEIIKDKRHFMMPPPPDEDEESGSLLEYSQPMYQQKVPLEIAQTILPSAIKTEVSEIDPNASNKIKKYPLYPDEMDEETFVNGLTQRSPAYKR